MKSTILKLRSLWRRVILKRYPLCVRCGAKATDAMHIFGKGIAPGLELDLDNGLGGCRVCHRELDHGADREEIYRIARSKLGIVKFEALSARRYKVDKYRDYEEIERKLTMELL